MYKYIGRQSRRQLVHGISGFMANPFVFNVFLGKTTLATYHEPTVPHHIDIIIASLNYCAIIAKFGNTYNFFHWGSVYFFDVWPDFLFKSNIINLIIVF